MTPAPQFGLVVTYVDDLASAKRFYTETLGLRVEREAPTFIQFEHFALATDESMDGLRNAELYWLVSDAEAACAEIGRKATICMPLRTLPFGKVFGVRDPSGKPRYLLQLASARPSRPPTAV